MHYRSHRPKSVVTEFSDDLIEDKVNLDSPPMPSALNHVSKCRPRPMRNFKAVKVGSHLNVIVLSH